MNHIPTGFVPLQGAAPSPRRCVLCGDGGSRGGAAYGPRGSSAITGVKYNDVVHNALPLAKGNCCEKCNEAVILVSARAEVRILRRFAASHPPHRAPPLPPPRAVPHGRRTRIRVLVYSRRLLEDDSPRHKCHGHIRGSRRHYRNAILTGRHCVRATRIRDARAPKFVPVRGSGSLLYVPVKRIFVARCKLILIVVFKKQNVQ